MLKNLNLINKIKEKNNLPLVLFFVVLVNYLPLFINNAFTKTPHSVSAIIMSVCFLIEIVILSFIYLKNKDDVKIEKRNIIIFSIIFGILLIVQLKNFLQKNFYIMDIFNIGCTCINILLLYIAVYDLKISEEKFIGFFKGIFWIGIVAIIWNLFLFNKEVLSELGFSNINTKRIYMQNIKSFFANRNSFAFFLYISLVSSIFIMNFDNTKKFYKYSILILLFGIWSTHSKTGFSLAIVLLELFILLNNDYKLKKKIIMFVVVAILGMLGMLNIMGYIPGNLNASRNGFDDDVISAEDIKRFSGRTAIWKAGIDILNMSPLNYVFGVGRFNSTHVLEFEEKTFTQFHNVYLDILLTGGIIELVYIGFIYFIVIKKILKSDLKKIFKTIYLVMYLTYFGYIMLESCGRFSIGCVDTLCMIFFVTIPLLHANSVKEFEANEERK